MNYDWHNRQEEPRMGGAHAAYSKHCTHVLLRSLSQGKLLLGRRNALLSEGFVHRSPEPSDMPRYCWTWAIALFAILAGDVQLHAGSGIPFTVAQWRSDSIS